MSLTQSLDLTILAQLQAYQHCDRWVVAYSGGVDSTVMLHSVVLVNQYLDKPKPITALHINHQLSAVADQWEQHCQQTAQSLNIDYFSQTVNIIPQGKGVEAAARDARYQVFKHYLQAGDCLLLAQHQTDQSETVLFRLLRGAGVKGLAGMSLSRPLGKAILLRPLLSASRKAVEAYAHTRQLCWVNDESNEDQCYDRNYLRHQVLPMVKQRWPSAETQLAATAERMQEADLLLAALAQSDLQQIDMKASRYGSSVDISQLMEASSIATHQRLFEAKIHNVLRYWCLLMKHPLPEAEHLQQIRSQFLPQSQRRSSACVSWKQTEARQFNGRLYVMPTLAPFTETSTMLEWNMEDHFSLGACGVLKWVEIDDQSHRALPLKKRSYTIRWRQGGERCRPSDRPHSQRLKKLLQEYGLETWLRDRVPLIYAGEELVAVGDLWVNKEYDSPSATTGVLWELAE